MNINLTPVSDSPKTKATASVGSGAASEVSDATSTESGGFFAAFSEMVGDLIDGDETAKNAPVDGAAKEGQAVDSEESEGKSVAKASDSESDESADALLKQASASDTDSKAVKSSNDEEDKSLDKAVTTAKSDKENQEQSSKSASQTVSESDELLDRLNESNNALKGNNGKPLPQQEDDGHPAAQVAAVAAGTKEQETQAIKQVVNKEQVDSTIEGGQSTSAELPESIKPFIQGEQVDNSLAKGDVASMSVQDGSPKNTDKDMLAAAVAGGQMVNQDDEIANAAQLTQVSPSKGQPVEGVDPRADTQAMQTVGSVSAADTSQIEQEAIVAAGMGASAIAWNNPASAEQAALDEVAMKASRGQVPVPQNQAVVAASVQQVLNQQHQTAAQAMSPLDKIAMENMASSMPADLTQAQLQQMVAANSALPTGVHGQASNQAALKAALGLKAANGINLAQSNDPKDAALAQQIAQAAGQQPGITATRTDAAAQAQAPMPLNREMATDQMAERVQMMMSKNLKNIDIRLDPPELGRMQIRMNMNGDNTAVHFTVSNPQAREMIEQSMPRLREMLAQQGMQLGDSSVQQQSAGQQQGRYAAQENQQSGQASGSQATNGDENLDSGTKVDLNVTTKRDGISYYA
ncbi:flagellar hook-length control protein FliK [Vibrio amylolyticus]|uniref:flagellar hook-length control protein FliK n=1 Tax=Vibrio amylolyticus TaxID=2847292 RepID=UPI0035541DF7